MKFVRPVLQVVLPFLVLGVGVMGFKGLMRSAPKTERKVAKASAPIVEVQKAALGAHRAEIAAMGRVMPSAVLVLQPEVAGRVIEHHPNLILGGRINAGEVLLRIDARDYKLAVKQQRANVARAKMEVKVEAGRRRIATREWKLVGKKTGADDPSRELVLRKPQEAAAKANLLSAKSGLARARLAERKTTIKAPFNVVVREEGVENGQLVGPASRLASLIGTDVFWVKVTIPVDRLSQIKIPGVNGVAPDAGASVKVVQALGTRQAVHKQGRVIRLLPDLEPIGKMAQLVVEVKNPLNDGKAGLPLILGATVNVKIEGPELKDVVSIPRRALRGENNIWRVSSESKLVIEPVSVSWREKDRVYLSGLKEGAVLVTSTLAAPVAGMALAVEKAEAVPKAKTAKSGQGSSSP